MKNLLAFSFVALLALSSCASGKSVALLSGEWQVVNIGGQEVTPSESTPFLGFDTDENRLYGYTGCNRLTGTLDAKAFMKGNPDFSNLGMTRMLCQDDRYETLFVDALNQVKTSEVGESEMLLKDKDGKVIITLKKK